LSSALSSEISATNSDVTSLSSAISGSDSSVNSLSSALSSEISATNSDVTSLSSALSSEISATNSDVTSLSTAISSIASPQYFENYITPANAGDTTGVTVSTTAFSALSVGETVSEESVMVYLNGLAYNFEYAQGEPAVFHTGGVTPTTSSTTLYFDGQAAGFAIETDDDVKLKYIVSS
jgi:trimeric autotransporter adhesin